MPNDLNEKAILVTGGASGIGEAVVRQLVALGAKVCVADANEEMGSALVAQLNASEAKGEVFFVATNVVDEAMVEQLIASVVDRYGALDGAVNNAGLAGNPCNLEDIELADWQRVIDVNLTGVFLCLKHELKKMKAQGYGTIVNVASGAGVIATPYMSMYGASKHGVLGLTKTAATENVRSGIRINAVLPGSTKTPMIEATIAGSEEMEKVILGSIPCGRMGTPEEIANAILWLLSEQSSYINGHSLIVDGGTICR